jgi:hypothetical protein
MIARSKNGNRTIEINGRGLGLDLLMAKQQFAIQHYISILYAVDKADRNCHGMSWGYYWAMVHAFLLIMISRFKFAPTAREDTAISRLMSEKGR